MAISSKKSCCLRVGPRCDKHCNNLYTSGGHLIPWFDEMRYLGLFIVQSHIFRCSLDHAKRSFYRAVNGNFGKIGRTASEEVVLELIKTLSSHPTVWPRGLSFKQNKSYITGFFRQSVLYETF